MLKFLTLTLVATLAFAALPTATADGCNAAASESFCTSETSHSSGTCENGSSMGSTHVMYSGAVATVQVTGFSYCNGFSNEWFSYTGRGDLFAAGASGGGQHVSFQWYSEEHTMNGSTWGSCQTTLGTSVAGQSQHGCPLGAPPTLPWGELLP